MAQEAVVQHTVCGFSVSSINYTYLFQMPVKQKHHSNLFQVKQSSQILRNEWLRGVMMF